MNRLKNFVIGVIQTFAKVGQDVLDLRNKKIDKYQVKVPNTNLLQNGDFSKSTLQANSWRLTAFMTDNVAIVDGYGRFRVNGASPSGRLERAIPLDAGVYSISFVTRNNPATGERFNFVIRSFVNAAVLTPVEEQFEDINDNERLHYATFRVNTSGSVTIRAYYGDEPVGTQIMVKFMNIVQGDVPLRNFVKSQQEKDNEVDITYLNNNYYDKNQIDGFQFVSQTYLVNNYYSKAQIDSFDFADKQYVIDMFENVTSVRFEVVNQLPTTGESNVIYLVPNGGVAPNIKDEYIWVDNQWELIGTTEIDLSNYVQQQEMEDYVSTNYIPQTHPSYGITSQNIQNWNGVSSLVNQGGVPRTSLLINNTIDLNELIEPGFYQHTGGSAPLNVPTSGAGSVIVTYAGGATFIKQVWQERDGQREFSRTRSSNLTWSAWALTWKSDNLRSNAENDNRYYTKTQIDGFGYLTGIPTATTSTLGGIKVGANLSVTTDGTLSATNTTYSNMSLAELNTGTVTTARTISAKNLNDWLNGKNYVTASIINGLASESWVDSNYIPQIHPSYNISDGDIFLWNGYNQRITTLENIQQIDDNSFSIGANNSDNKYLTDFQVNRKVKNKIGVAILKEGMILDPNANQDIAFDYETKRLITGFADFTELFDDGTIDAVGTEMLIKERGTYQISIVNIGISFGEAGVKIIFGDQDSEIRYLDINSDTKHCGLFVSDGSAILSLQLINRSGTNNLELKTMELEIIKIN